MWVRREPRRQMLLPPIPLNQSKSLYCSTQFSAVLVLSSQVHKNDVHACKVPDLLLDQAFAGSVTAGRFISAGKALFWQVSASLRKECRSSESPSKLAVFFKLKLKGSRHPSYLKGVQTVPLSSRGTNLSWNNCTLSPLAGYLSAKTKMSSGLEGVGRPVSAGVLTDMAIVLQKIACVASAVPSLSTCRMVLPGMRKFSRKMSFSFSMPNHIHWLPGSLSWQNVALVVVYAKLPSNQCPQGWWVRQDDRSKGVIWMRGRLRQGLSFDITASLWEILHHQLFQQWETPKSLSVGHNPRGPWITFNILLDSSEAKQSSLKYVKLTYAFALNYLESKSAQTYKKLPCPV